MKRYAHVLRALYDEPWALLPAKLEVILELLQFRADGGAYTAAEIEQRIGAVSRGGQMVTGDVAVIPVFGVLAQHGGLLSESSGGVSTDGLTEQLQSALANPSVGSIVLNMDSPGGSVYGIQELAAQIAQAKGIKPVVAVANSLMASAAYWLGSQATELVVTPSGEVGSIGVLAAHTDTSEADAAQGIRTTLVSAGKYKTEGNPYQPLAEDARAWIQGRVNDYYEAFVQAVASGRGANADQVRNGFGEGRVVGAKQAVRLGMADKVATLGDTVKRLQSGRARVGSKSAEDLAAEIAASAEERAPLADAADLDFRRRRLRLAESGLHRSPS